MGASIALLLILQRYSNLSKSQPTGKKRVISQVVTHTAKVLKFKQITTFGRGGIKMYWLLLILQRYSNLSKSQQEHRTNNLVKGCYSYCKGTQI